MSFLSREEIKSTICLVYDNVMFKTHCSNENWMKCYVNIYLVYTIIIINIWQYSQRNISLTFLLSLCSCRHRFSLVHNIFVLSLPLSFSCHWPRCIKFAFERKSEKSNANWVLTNQNRALRICVWFFWLAFKRKFYATGPLCCLVNLYVTCCLMLSRVPSCTCLIVGFIIVWLRFITCFTSLFWFLLVLFALILPFCIFIEGPTHYKHCFLSGFLHFSLNIIVSHCIIIMTRILVYLRFIALYRVAQK